jgi:hypothetical protein
MSRHLLTIHSDADRARVVQYASAAPVGTKVEFKAVKRSLPQNDRLWANLTDVARQKEHCGRKYPPEAWKSIFMNAWGKQSEFMPTLDGSSFFPLGYRSSELTKDEMSELIEFIIAWGTQNGVVFHDQAQAA